MNYDPTKVLTVIDGFTVTGFTEDSMVSVSRTTEKRSMTTGVDGLTDFVESADDSASVTISLKHTSPANEKLMGLYKSGDEFDFSVVDQNFDGDVSSSGSRCKVQSLPENSRSNEISTREWVLLVADYEEAFEGVL